MGILEQALEKFEGRVKISGEIQSNDEVGMWRRYLYLGSMMMALAYPEAAEARRFQPDYWPHDLISGSEPPSAGEGVRQLLELHQQRLGALTLRSVDGVWVDGADELKLVAKTGDTKGMIGAAMVITYTHDKGPITLPNSDRSFDPTGRDVTLETLNVIKFDGGLVAESWDQSIAIDLLLEQFEQNERAGKLPFPE